MHARMNRTTLLAGLVAASLLATPAARAGGEDDLVAILKSDAPPAAKCDACARLKIAGTAASVPALAGDRKSVV